VPGASSWTSAWANLNCDGSSACKGTPHSSATGITGNNHQNSGEGSRGPPEATGTTTSTCDTTSAACQALSTSSAASGQVVADILTEQNKSIVEQAKQDAADAKTQADEAKQVAAAPGATEAQKQAATKAATTAEQATKAYTGAAEAIKKPLPEDQVPATWSQSSSVAQCAGSAGGTGCTATTTGDTTGAPGTSHTGATCTATGGSGCAATSDATTMLMRDSGQRTQDGKAVPGISGTAEASSGIVCPEAGCTGKVTGKANATAGEGKSRTSSDGEGNTACDGTGPCQAGIRASVGTAAAAGGVPDEQRFATSSVNIAASCDNGGTGCPIHATSSSNSTGGKSVNTKTTTSCEGNAGCTTGTSGTASPDMAQVQFQCGGAGGCTAHAEGDAKASKSSGTAAADCSPTKNGQCAGGVQVGASDDGSALAGATCQGTEGTKCHYRFEAKASDSSRAGPNWAKADAHGSEEGENGGGAVQVMAATMAGNGEAQASAVCKGAKNCTNNYSAHAEAHDYYEVQASKANPDQPSGYGKADASGTCRGNKSGGGSCGVQAEANARAAVAKVRCSGDCSNFTKEQEGATGFVKTGPSYNEIQAAIAAAAAARAAHQVKDIDKWMEGQDGRTAGGVKRDDKGNYTIWTRGDDGKVTSRPCSAAECGGQTIDVGGSKVTFPKAGDKGNVGVTRPTGVPNTDDHSCNASVGCAISGDNKGKGDGGYWIAGDGTVHDGITASNLTYRNSLPTGSKDPNLNEGSFGNTKGKAFEFTCNGGCDGDSATSTSARASSPTRSTSTAPRT
jgi:hypothetical protein